MKTNREKEVFKALEEFRNKKIISINELDNFFDKVHKVLLELERMRTRLNKLKESKRR